MCCNEKKHGCRKPENLKVSPEGCTPEQIRECHGDSAGHPCVESKGCEHPERLQGNPGDCTPEQIRQCHGNVTAHPCVGE